MAVVTGASKGIGVAIARHLAAEDASVVVNYLSSREGADKVVNDIVMAGGKAIARGRRCYLARVGWIAHAPCDHERHSDSPGWLGRTFDLQKRPRLANTHG